MTRSERFLPQGHLTAALGRTDHSACVIWCPAVNDYAFLPALLPSDESMQVIMLPPCAVAE
jgi:hypothetical protein